MIINLSDIDISIMLLQRNTTPSNH